MWLTVIFLAEMYPPALSSLGSETVNLETCIKRSAHRDSSGDVWYRLQSARTTLTESF